jgi:hypothetical protein
MLDRFASEQMIGLTSECVIGMPRNIHVVIWISKRYVASLAFKA